MCLKEKIKKFKMLLILKHFYIFLLIRGSLLQLNFNFNGEFIILINKTIFNIIEYNINCLFVYFTVIAKVLIYYILLQIIFNSVLLR